VRVLGALIAGGHARRFGSDKAAALLHGKPLINHVADAMRAQVEALVVVGRSWPGLSALADRPAGAMGPLAGLNAALLHAREAGFDGVLTAGCDTLPIPSDMAALLAGAEPAFLDGHYLLGWWPVRLADGLDAHLANGPDRSMRGWIALCNARAVPPPLVLNNLNTPADLAAYARITAS
jgi:molybdopterin-guanine dinucleotide biosynthesis protein A